MQFIKYQVMQETNMGTAEEPNIVKSLHAVTLGPMSDASFETNYAIAQAEAYHGEVTVEDIPDPAVEPTPQEDADAMLVDHEYRPTLLELGLTE